MYVLHVVSIIICNRSDPVYYVIEDNDENIGSNYEIMGEIHIPVIEAGIYKPAHVASTSFIGHDETYENI